jgi:hypothetical protein
MAAVGFCGAPTGLMFQIRPFDLLGKERPGRPGQGSRVGIGIGIGISGAGDFGSRVDVLFFSSSSVLTY